MKIVNGWHFPNFDNLLSGHVKTYPQTTYQQTAINAALDYVKSFDLAIDVGANVGLHSVRFSKIFKNVFSYEPSSLNFECLKKNTESLANVNINQFALGDREEILEISIPSEYDNCGAFSFVDFKNLENNLIKEKSKIDILDRFNLSPELIKVDTQGYELNVLKGSMETLKRSKPVLILEVSKKNFSEIDTFLSTFGYTSVDRFGKDVVWRCE